VLFAFALTRLLVLSLFVLTAKFEVSRPDPQGSYEARFSLHSTAFARILRENAQRGDGSWYMSIAKGGYERRAFTADVQRNWAFFPLFPLVLRAASHLTGELPLTGIALSHLFFFFALLLLHRTALLFGLDADDARRTVFYIAAFPVSYFFSLLITESLFLLLTVGGFYAAKREHWLAAGLLGALASATRATGILLLPALALVYWETYRTLKPRLNFLPLLLIPAGLLSYMYFLREITGNPFAFRDILVAWGRKPRFFLATLYDYVSDPLLLAIPWDFRLVNFLCASTALACGAALLWRRSWSLAFYTLAATFVTLTSGMLQSQARYAMLVFPAFMALAAAGRDPRRDRLMRTAALILLAMMTVLYARDINIALS
jgi:hypothetical protein